MNLKDNSQVQELDLKIGKVKYNKNIKMVQTGIWAAVTIYHTSLLLQKPSPLAGVCFGIDFIFMGTYINEWEKEQKELNELREKRNAIQKTYTLK